ncbi:MAG: bifunctional aldolase/short-chain dehydrogenase [Rhodospirillales bacterium]|nr:bifunctional aldolase/short-chain dehydrogenase [Rhodospirillales bacterium]
MKNLWSDREAKSYIRKYARQGVNEDLALRVYTTRLLGGEPRLVLHGGGNTSVKTVVRDVLGDPTEVLCVKGSGWDMGDIEPSGLPAVRMQPLLRMAKFKKLSDEEMVNAQRVNLLDSRSPNPSVETLLHAFLPAKFIDHTHSNAVVAVTDTTDGLDRAKQVFGDSMGYVPYIMPGFDLSKEAMEVFNRDPGVEGLILLKHGIFTFGDTAKQAYDRMLHCVNKAEKHLATGKKTVFPGIKLPKKIATVADVAPILRGLTSRDGKPLILDFRTSKEILAYVNGKDIQRYSQQGTATPEHVIHAKGLPLVTPVPEVGKLDQFRKQTEKEIAHFIKTYNAYFARNNAKANPKKTKLDPTPRVLLVPGVGLFGLGTSRKKAAVTADMAVAGVEVITASESIGSFKVITEKDRFDIEYWSLEQAKLASGREAPLARRVCVVTGGASGIGAATARAFAAEGAEVCVLDRDLKAARQVAGPLGGLAIACDVTKPKQVRAAFDAAAAAFGGVDIVVSNAGAAWQGRIGEVDDKTLRDSFELNFWAHQTVAQNAVRVMTAQGQGGCLLFNTSKQAINPGRDFGPYGLPKAATLFLMRQYALDYGPDGIRANAVNADRIRSGLLTDAMVKSRSGARGLSETEYMSGNLLGREVLAEDVAQAFVDLAKAEKTTAAVITVDGGNIAAALR